MQIHSRNREKQPVCPNRSYPGRLFYGINNGLRVSWLGSSSLSAQSAGSSTKINRNPRDSCSGRLHQKRLPAPVSANGNEGREGVTIRSCFYETVGVSPGNLASYAISAFEPIPRKCLAVLVDIATQLELKGVAGTAQIQFNRLTGILNIVISFASDGLMQTIRGFNSPATRPRASQIFKGLLRVCFRSIEQDRYE